MHHYGENAIKVFWSSKEPVSDSAEGGPLLGARQETFIIEVKNHITGAELTLTGPQKGVFLDKDRMLTAVEAENLGRDLAHLLRGILQ